MTREHLKSIFGEAPLNQIPPTPPPVNPQLAIDIDAKRNARLNFYMAATVVITVVVVLYVMHKQDGQ